MTGPTAAKPRLVIQLNLPQLSSEFLRQDNLLQALDLNRTSAPLQFTLLRFDGIPNWGSCGILRNNSIFGCSYLDAAGRETRLGMNFKTYPRGLGLSLKIFLGGD